MGATKTKASSSITDALLRPPLIKTETSSRFQYLATSLLGQCMTFLPVEDIIMGIQRVCRYWRYVAFLPASVPCALGLTSLQYRYPSFWRVLTLTSRLINVRHLCVSSQQLQKCDFLNYAKRISDNRFIKITHLSVHFTRDMSISDLYAILNEMRITPTHFRLVYDGYVGVCPLISALQTPTLSSQPFAVQIKHLQMINMYHYPRDYIKSYGFLYNHGMGLQTTYYQQLTSIEFVSPISFIHPILEHCINLKCLSFYLPPCHRHRQLCLRQWNESRLMKRLTHIRLKKLSIFFNYKYFYVSAYDSSVNELPLKMLKDDDVLQLMEVLKDDIITDGHLTISLPNSNVPQLTQLPHVDELTLLLAPASYSSSNLCHISHLHAKKLSVWPFRHWSLEDAFATLCQSQIQQIVLYDYDDDGKKQGRLGMITSILETWKHVLPWNKIHVANQFRHSLSWNCACDCCKPFSSANYRVYLWIPTTNVTDIDHI